MTREERLDWLHKLRSEVETSMPHDWVKPMTDTLKESIKILEQEPCEDAISRARVVEWLQKCTDDSIEHAIDSNIEFIPSVCPTERVGRWIPHEHDQSFCRCSECNICWSKGYVINCHMKYCPYCGAKMESEK